MQIRVRDARREDGDQLLALVRALNNSQDNPVEHFDAAALERDVFADDAYLNALVAESTDGLVGYALFHEGYESAFAQRGAYLCDLYVDEPARRKGVGRALVAAVARHAKKNGRSFLWWVSKEWNQDARALYASLGAKSESVFAHALTFSAFESLADEVDDRQN